MTGERSMTTQEMAIHSLTNNKSIDGPDLTTAKGAFWLMKRLPDWDRFGEFCGYIVEDKVAYKDDLTATNELVDILTWLGSKPSALFDAIVEFEGLEVKPAFTCPDCNYQYPNYYDGHDCSCGKIHLCSTCYIQHKAHDGATK